VLAVDAQGGSLQAQDPAGLGHLHDLLVLDPFHGLPARPHQILDRLHRRTGFDQARREVKHPPASHHCGISFLRDTIFV